MRLSPAARKWRLALPLAGLASVALACANGQVPPGDGDTIPAPEEQAPNMPAGGTTEPALETIYSDAYSGIDEQRRSLIRTEAEWREVWSDLTAGREPRTDPLPIDFGRQVVVVATMGSRPTGGYAIEIEGIRLDGERLVVEVVETSPGPGCMLTQAFTAPAVAVAVEARPTEASYVDREATRSCG